MLHDPLALARTFISQDGSYQNYDLAEVPLDASLSENDVRVANRIIARMGPDTVAAILSRAPEASRALERIPSGASLVADDADVPWGPLRDLFRAFEGLPGVGLPRLTKVLHKKRPALIPILDSIVDRYLGAVGEPIAGGLAERGAALTRRYKEELDASLPVLACVRWRQQHLRWYIRGYRKDCDRPEIWLRVRPESDEGTAMRIEYDPRVDAAYIYLVEEILAGGVALTYPCDPLQVNGEINLDFDADGRLIGVEVLDASRFLPKELLVSAPPPGGRTNQEGLAGGPKTA